MEQTKQKIDERGVKRDWTKECDEADRIMQMLGMDPLDFRSEGGSLKVRSIVQHFRAPPVIQAAWNVVHGFDAESSEAMMLVLIEDLRKALTPTPTTPTVAT